MLSVALIFPADDSDPAAVEALNLADALAGIAEIEQIRLNPAYSEKESLIKIAESANRADVVHIQHTHLSFGGILPSESFFWSLRYLIDKPLVITAHDTRSLAELLRSQRNGLIQSLADSRLLLSKSHRDSVDTAPFATGRCIVHTAEDSDRLVKRGVKPNHMHIIKAGTDSESWRGSAEQTLTAYRAAIEDVQRLSHHMAPAFR